MTEFTLPPGIVPKPKKTAPALPPGIIPKSSFTGAPQKAPVSPVVEQPITSITSGVPMRARPQTPAAPSATTETGAFGAPIPKGIAKTVKQRIADPWNRGMAQMEAGLGASASRVQLEKLRALDAIDRMTTRGGAGPSGFRSEAAESRLDEALPRTGEQDPLTYATALGDIDVLDYARALTPEDRAAVRQRVEGVLGSQVREVVSGSVRAAAIPKHPSVAKAQAAKSFGEFWDAFLEAPGTFITDTVIESAPNMIPTIIGGAVGGPIAGRVGFAAGAGGASGLVELGSSIASRLQELGADMEDPESIRQVLQDHEAEIFEYARNRAVAVGLFDAMGARLAAGKLVPGRPVAEAVGQAVAGGAYGGAGEITASLRTGETPGIGAVASEVLGDVVSQAGEVAVAGAEGLRGQKPPVNRRSLEQFVNTPAQPQQDAAQPPPYIKSVQQPETPGPASATPAGAGTKDSPRVIETPQDLVEATSQAATSPMNPDSDPSDDEKAAGNYKKAHVILEPQGPDGPKFRIAIENPKGSVRKSRADAPVQWENEMPAHYGYDKDVEDADGDKHDVFIGDLTQFDEVYVIDQLDPETGEFDEHKTFMGVPDMVTAIQLYDQSFGGSGQDRIGAVTPMAVGEYDTWKKSGRTKRAVGNIAAAQQLIRDRLAERQALAASSGAAPAVPNQTQPAPSSLPKGIVPKASRGRKQAWVSITAIAKKWGGIVDYGGELRAMDMHRKRPGSVRVPRDDGSTPGMLGPAGAKRGLDAFGEHLFQTAEYRDLVQDDSDPDTWDIDKVIELLRQDLAGRPPVPRGSEIEASDAQQASEEEAFRGQTWQVANAHTQTLLGRDLDEAEFEAILKKYVTEGYDSIEDAVTDQLESDIIADVGAIENEVEAQSAQEARSQEAPEGDRDQPSVERESEGPSGQTPEDEARPQRADQDQGLPRQQGPKTELTDQGEQGVMPGMERSARQAAQARDERYGGRSGTDRQQDEPGGMFERKEEPDGQADIEDVRSELPAGPSGQALTDRLGRPVFQTVGEIEAAVQAGTLGTDPARAGFCYKFAGIEAINNGGWFAIGTLQGQKGRTYHAVVIKDGLIYDPQYDRWFDAKAYSESVGNFAIMHWMSGTDVARHGSTTGQWPDPKNLSLPPAEDVALPAAVRTQGRGRPDLVIDTKPKGPPTQTGRKIERAAMDAPFNDVLPSAGHELTEGEVDEVKRFAEIIGDQYLGNVKFVFHRTTSEREPMGVFWARKNSVEIFERSIREGKFTETMVHELWHALTRHLPANVKKAVIREFKNKRAAFIKANPWFDIFVDVGSMSITGMVAKDFLARFPDAEKNGDVFVWTAQDGTTNVSPSKMDVYRYMNADEFFAETMTDLTIDKLDSESEQVNALWKVFRQIYREIVFRLQRLFGENIQEQIYRGFADREFAPQATAGLIGWQDKAELPGWHGSPHRGIQKFKSEAIGTGEGNQTYGWGLYFAGAKAVAEHYREKLTRGKGSTLDGMHPEDWAASKNLSLNDVLYAQAVIRKHGNAEGREHMRKIASIRSPIVAEREQKAFDAVAAAKIVKPGALYKVELQPKEDEYLDFDKPLNQQSAHVKGAIDSIGGFVREQMEDMLSNSGYTEMEETLSTESSYSGKDLYNLLVSVERREGGISEAADLDATPEDSKEAVSRYLHQLGIRGNRYLDAHSRAIGDGTSNYVIFDENDVSLVEDVSAEMRQFGNPNAGNVAIRQAGQQIQLDILKQLHRPGWRAAAERRLRSFRLLWRDRFATMADIEKYIEGKTGQRTPAQKSFYKQEEVFTGKVADQIQQFHEGMLKELYDAMHDTGLSVKEIEKYLVAMHAPERNATIAAINPKLPDGGSGMMNAQAQAVIDGFRQAGKLQVLQRVTAAVKRVRMFDLNTRVAAGLIPARDVAEKIRDWPNYVPLKGFEELFTDDELVSRARPRIGSGFSVKNREYLAALGRSSEAQNILANLISQAEESIVRAEKTKVSQVLADFITANPDPSFWSVDLVTTKRVIDPDTGLVMVQQTRTPSLEDEEQFVIYFKRDGQLHRIWLANPRLVANIRNMSANELPKWTKALQLFATIFRAVNVNANPEFVIPNAARDLETGLVQALQHKAPGLKRKMVKYWPQAAKASWSGYSGRGGPQGSWNNWYRRMARAGGKVDFFNIDDIESQVSSVHREMRRRSGKPLAHAENAVVGVYKLIDRANHAVENAVRLASFRAMVEAGFTDAEAASVSKNITVNFNRRGEVSRWANLLWPFFNAAVQGTFTLGTAAVRSRKVRGALIGLTMMGFAEGIANGLASAGGDDEDDESDFDKIPEYIRRKNIIIMNPGYPDNGGPPYWPIPLGYGINVFWNAGREMSDLLLGKKTIGEALGNVGVSAADAFIPVDVDQLTGLLPSFAQAPGEVLANRDFSGKPVYREPSYSEERANLPDSSITRPGTNEAWKATARALNTMSGGTDYEPGLFDFHPESMEHIFKTYAGGVGSIISRTADLVSPEPGDKFEFGKVPVIRKVIGYFPRSTESNRYYESRGEIQEISGRLKAAEESGDDETAERLATAGDRQLGLETELKGSEKRLTALRKEAREVRKEPGMPAEERKAALSAIYEEMDAETGGFNKTFYQEIERPRQIERSPTIRPMFEKKRKQTRATLTGEF